METNDPYADHQPTESCPDCGCEPCECYTWDDYDVGGEG